MSTSIFCGKCGHPIDELPGTVEGNRRPCPKCGSRSRNHKVDIHDGEGMTEEISAQQKNKGRTKGFVGMRQGRTATGFQQEDGSLSYGLEGTSPQGEDDTPETCRILIKKLNQLGANWDVPLKGQEPADCECHDNQSPDKVLHIQVTHAIAAQPFWRELNKQGKIAKEGVAPEELLGYIREAIEAKLPRIPQPSRADLVLALDATRLPGLSFDAIVHDFRQKYGSWTASLGFQSVWLVGPNESLTWRLDAVT